MTVDHFGAPSEQIRQTDRADEGLKSLREEYGLMPFYLAVFRAYQRETPADQDYLRDLLAEVAPPAPPSLYRGPLCL